MTRRPPLRPHLCMLLAALLLAPGSSAWAAPRAVVQGEHHLDAGEIEPGKVLEYDFVLRNQGDASLAIQDLKPTCYCTSARTDLWDVPPGGTATIHVRIDPSDFVGKINKGVEITTNDPANPTLLVDVDIVVLPGIAVLPPELDLGSVGPEGTKKSLKVEVKIPREREMEILGVSSDAAYLEVTHEPLQLEERHGATIWVKVRPGVPAGPFATKVLVKTSDPSRPSIEIPVRGRGPGGLVAQPDKVVFETAAAGSEVGAFEVKGGKNLQVRSSTPSLLAEIEPSAGGAQRVKLRLAGNARSGRLLAKVTVTTADTSQPELVVPVMGLVR
ncbi:MAG TPA: DUF1573 domain-containing protein [Candidatus Krumholzibacteria bacterium]|nr:DUF1573 domain-containing protein [Candidatus Krumholzibacteria bacterium]